MYKTENTTNIDLSVLDLLNVSRGPYHAIPHLQAIIILIMRCYSHDYWVMGPLIGCLLSPGPADWPGPVSYDPC